MMKTLLLMRHGKAAKDDGSLADMERPLTDRGKEDAEEMGRRLKKSAYKPQHILASPSKRSAKTAKIVGEALGLANKHIAFDQEIYEAGIDSLLRVIRR